MRTRSGRQLPGQINEIKKVPLMRSVAEKRLQKQENEELEREKANGLKPTFNETLEKLYSNIRSVPSYSAKIADFLKTHDTHSQYRRIIKRNFPRRRVIARFPFEIWMGDLIEYPNYKFYNNGFKYILLLIDCFTKVVYSAPLKRKAKEYSADAFESIFKNLDQFPINLVTDGGREFFNTSVNKIFDNYGIHHYKTVTKTSWKASQAERAIKTIKTRLEKYFALNKTKKWINVLEQFVNNYNETPHSSHGLAPINVNDENRDHVYKTMYPKKDLTVVCRLKKGDKVRKIREKKLWEKGYTANWSEEIFVISSVRQSNTVCYYKLSHIDGEEISGIYYYYQLNLVSSNVDKPELGKQSED